MLDWPDGRWGPLLFDASPLLPSGVFAGPDGSLLTGVDAQRAAVAYPAGYEPSPKQRVGDATVWLADREIAVVDLVAAVLGRVAAEARRVVGGRPESVVLTHPTGWAGSRLGVLALAAERAGLGEVAFVAEPVAAAAYFVTVLGGGLAPDRPLVVYDLGAGTFDVAVVRAGAGGLEVVGSAGLPDVGGLDLDALVVDHVRRADLRAAGPGGEAAGWRRLDQPVTVPDRRARYELWSGARAAKEQLSRHPSADVYVPLLDVLVPVTREEFETAARPVLERAAGLTLRLLHDGGMPPDQTAGVFLVGGASRIPLAATVVHRIVGVAPTVIEQPEIVVAQGSVHYPSAGSALAAPRSATPVPAGGLPAASASVPNLAASPPPGQPLAVSSMAAAGVTRRRPASVVAAAATVAVVLVAVVAVVAWRAWSDRAGAGVRFAPTASPSPVDQPVLGAALVATLTGHTDQVWRVAFSPDSATLASVGRDRTVRLWDVQRRQELGAALVGHTNAVDDVAFSPDGKVLATIDYDNTLRLWDVADRVPVGAPITTVAATVPTCIYVAFSRDGRTLATSCDRAVRLWDATTHQQRGPTLASAAYLARNSAGKLAFLPDGRTLAVCVQGDQVDLWDVPSGRPLATPPSPRTSDPFPREVFSPDGAGIAVVTDGHDAQLWDPVTHRLVNTLTGSAANLDVWDLALSSHSRTLAIADRQAQIRLWDTAANKPIGDPIGEPTIDPSKLITTMAFSGDGRYLAVGSDDHTIRLYALIH